jgi:hypothetical protein
VSNKHEDAHVLTRREFTVESALAILAGVTITISGCGDDSNPPASPTPPPSSSGVTGSVSANHGHVASISSAQLTTGGALNLDIRGQADHPHSVQLSADEMTRIAARSQVTKSSSSDNGHSHSVTFN